MPSTRVEVEVTYNAHRYGDCSDTPKTKTRRFRAPGDMDDALALFYDWRRAENERFTNGQRKTCIGNLTSKCIVEAFYVPKT